MDLAIQATSYSFQSPIQNRAAQPLAAPQAVSAGKPETSARNAQEDARLNQARQQANAPARAANQPSGGLISRTNTDFEYEDTRSVMKVTDKDVLIYQVPAKGALEIIKAEAKEASSIETAV
jgi:hypothetical protein